MKRRRRPPIKLSPFLIAKLDVTPGDTVVLQTDLVLDRDQAEALRERMDAQLAHLNVRSIIISAGLKIGVMRRRKKTA